MTTGSADGARSPRTAAPNPAELLRATLEKIVFFEWRVSELAAELAATLGRASAAEQERARAQEENHQARREAHAARHQLTELEAERARLATLLARPAHRQVDGAALEAERARTAQLAAELTDARREVQRQKDERARWLQEMIDQAREGDEAPAALAQFISELRAEVIALRERQRQCDLLLEQAGLTPPAAALPEPPRTAPARHPDAVETARRLWDEGRLEVPLARHQGALPVDVALPRKGALPAATDLLPGLAALRAAPAVATPAPSPRALQSAHRALADQCLRGLVAHDPARRAQAARHLAALPVPAAAPGLAAALGRETDPRARAEIARALAACGGDEASEMVLQLLAPSEPALVRLAALDALAVPDGRFCRAALEAGAADPAPAVRRRTASLALSTGGADDHTARLFADPESSVRAAAGGGDHVPEAPLAPEEPAAEQAPTPIAGPFARLAPPLAETVPEPLPVRERPSLMTEAMQAIRAALFGLTEGELAEAVGLAPSQGPALAQSLLGQGLLARRGRRLVASADAEPLAQAERGA